MFSKRPFIRIIIIFIITLTGFLLLYPVIRKTYLDFLITNGNKYFKHPGKETLVKWLENEDNKDMDLKFYIGNTLQMETNPNAMYIITKVSTLYIAWLPLALMMALVLASPIPFLRKSIVFIVGIFTIHLLVYLKLLIHFYHVCNWHPQLGILLLSLKKVEMINFLQDQFVDTVQPTLILVIIIWILITFTVKDYKKLMVLKIK